MRRPRGQIAAGVKALRGRVVGGVMSVAQIAVEQLRKPGRVARGMLAAATALVLAGACWADVAMRDTETAPAEVTRPAIVAGKEATFPVSPLKADGTVDYVKALDALYAQGVSDDENAFPLLLRVSGVDRATMPEGYVEELRRRYGLKEEAGVWVSLRKQFGEAEYRREQELLGLQGQLWKERDHPELAAWLTVNEGGLKLVAEAAGRARLVGPAWSRDGSVMALELPPLPRYRGLGLALTARGNAALGGGRCGGRRG